MAQSQDKEIGSVLIAVNSYAQAGDQLPTLPYARQVLLDYIDTFKHLFFKVECLFDYTLEAFEMKFAEFCEKSVGDHVVVILYGHGGIFGGIECQHTLSDLLPTPHLESTFAEKCRYKNRYLLLDICRIIEEGACAPNLVYQANTQGGTYIVHSTLTFHRAERNMWSRLLARNLRDVDATLDKVIDSVDGQIKRLHPGLQQVSHTQSKGSHGAPNFKQLANFKNFSVPSSENLRQPVDKADNYMAAIQPPRNPVMASFGNLAPSKPSYQQRPTDNDQLLSEAALGNPNQPSAQGQQYMADQPRADREMGAVLIAVNSYRHNSKLFPLHYADRVLKGYIETFYRYLFFNVHVVVDFTGKDFKSNLNEFTTWCQQHEMTRIAVVFYGHGGIVKGKECVFTDIGEPLAIADLEVALHSRCPKDNKYLFIDACRELQSGPKIVPDSYVFQTNTDCTTVIRSTLLFKRAYSNAWSEFFAMSLRNHGTLVDIVNTVDDRMKHSVGDYQKSDMVFRGALDSPNFRGVAVANNNAEGIRKLSTYLQERIKVVEQNFEALRSQQYMADQPRAGQEMGAVLIAVNSYHNNSKLLPLHYADRVLKGYMETFYRYLFFHIDVAVNFTETDFKSKLDEFTAWCQLHKMTRIAVVFYGYGGIVNGKECVFTDIDEPLEIAELEVTLHSQSPKANKYLFIDACREFQSAPDNIPKQYVFQGNTDCTTLIRSTLLFEDSYSNAWSECFAMNLRNHGTLVAIVNTVDDLMKQKFDDMERKHGVGDYQKSEIVLRGVADEPNFRGIAVAANNAEGICKLPPSLQEYIKAVEQNFEALRKQLDLPPKPMLAFLDSLPDSPSNQPAPGLGLPIAQEFTSGPEHTCSKTLCDNPLIQSLKRHVMKRYEILNPSESRVMVEYVQLALLEARPYKHHEDEELKKRGGNKLDWLESFKSCGLKSGEVRGFVDIADLLKPTSDTANRMKVVYGQAGIGKTTMLTHICRSLTLDKPMKSSYALVLYFPLRVEKVSSAEKLRDLLSYYTSVKSLSEAVEQALDDSGGKEVLIIFDGADEVQDLLSSGVCQELLEGLALPLADVIVSSRPGGLPHLMKQNLRAVYYEIHGLPKLSIEKYIEDSFKCSPDKGEHLWKELQSRDDLMGAAHIPMNLLIFCSIFGKEGLPRTLTDCYKQFIVKVHNRESPKKKWKRFDLCPEDVKSLLHSLGRLAYNGLMSTPSTFVFEEEDVEEAFKTTSLAKSTFKGLLHKHTDIFEVYGSNSTYTFSHAAQQELFSAYYISHLPVGEQIEFLKGNCSNPMVLRFYAGLTGLVDEQVVHTVLHEPGFFDDPFLRKVSTTGQSICAFYNLYCSNDDPGLMHLFHFLYESQNSELTQSVARHLGGKSMRFNIFLTSYDTRVIAYCLRKSHSFSKLTFDGGRTADHDSEHVLSCVSSILESGSVAQIQELTLTVDRLTQTGGIRLKKGLAKTAVDVMHLNMTKWHIEMSAIAAVFEAPGLKRLELTVMCPDGFSDSDLEVAQSSALNSRIKELVVFSLSSSLLLSVVKGLAANTCVEKLVLEHHQLGDGGDGGVAQALAKTCTTNTTLKDIELNGVSPFPLTEVLCNRAVPLQRLAIKWAKDYSDSDLQVAQSSARNTRIKELMVHIGKNSPPSFLPVVKGLAANTCVEKLALENILVTGGLTRVDGDDGDDGDDGGVGQALAAACTTNTTLKDIRLAGCVSPFPLMEVLCNREVPLERLDIRWDDNYYRGSDLELDVAQSSARNTRIKKLKIHTYLQPSLLLLSVVKGLGANTCVEKLDLDSGLRGDGGVGQALATAYTTNTTLKDIQLRGISPVPLMKVLCSREVLLERLRISWCPDSVSADSDLEVAQSTARNSRIKELNVQSEPSLLLSVVKGLAANTCAEKLALYNHQFGRDGGDGGVGQALATACTTNTTLKDIQLWGVSPVPLMAALCRREVPLERLSLAILWYPGSDRDSDLEAAQSTARNTRIKELDIYSQPSLLLPVMKGLATNTCLEKLVLRSSGGDGGVGQALATTCTTNTTLKDIELRSVSPVPLMKVLCSREVPLKRLSIIWDSLSKDLSPCTPEALETLAQDMQVKRFERSDLRRFRTEYLKALADGLSRNKSLKEVDLTLRWGVPDDVKDYISAKLSTLETVKIHYL